MGDALADRYAKASEIIQGRDVKKMIILRDKLIDGILEIPDVKLNGPQENRLCNNANFLFEGLDGEAVGEYLEGLNIYTSTGSACMSHSSGPSHVLMAIGRTKEQAGNSKKGFI